MRQYSDPVPESLCLANSSGRRLSVDRPEGFLALAVVSLEDLVIEVKKFTVLKLSLCLNGKVVSTFLKPKRSVSF